MYDPDPARPALRLTAPARQPRVETQAEIDALASDDEVIMLLRMLCNAALDARARHAQSQPISAQRVTQNVPVIFRANGTVERLDRSVSLDAPL